MTDGIQLATVRSAQLCHGNSISEKIEPLDFALHETQLSDLNALSAQGDVQRRNQALAGRASDQR